MNDVEKRELFEQQRTILEAGAQRADKRTGSFSFLTSPFFIAPLIAGEEFLAATLKSSAAEEEEGKAAQAGAAPQAANDDPPASDPAKMSAENETAKEPAASSEPHAAQLDPTGVPSQPHEDAPKPSTGRSEAAAAAMGGGGDGGGGGGDADSSHNHAHTSIHGSSVNALSAVPNLGSSQLSGGPTLESVQFNVLGHSFGPSMFGPSIVGPAPLIGTVGGLSNDVVGAIAPVEAAVQPVLATATETLGTLTKDGAIAPVEAAVHPVLATATETLGTLTKDVVGAIAPVEAALQPALATVTDTVGTLTNDVVGAIAPVEAALQPVLATVTDTVGTLTNDVVGAIAPVEAAVQPVLATVTDTMGTLTAEVAGAIADPALAPAPGSDADPSSHGITDTSMPALHIGSAGMVSGAVTPVLPDLVDLSQAAAPDTTGGLTNHAVASAAPVVDTADPLLAAITDAANQPTLPQTVALDSAGAHTLGSSASTVDVAEPAPTGSGSTGAVAQPGNLASDTLANAAPVVDTTEPVLASAGVSHSNPATDLLHPAVPDTSAGQDPGSADTLLALATATNAPIEIPGSATAAPASAATDLSNAAAAHPAIAGDVIALNDAPLPPANALFTGTQYTDYGVTLSSDIAVPPQHAVSPADSASAHDSSVPVVADVQQHALPPPDIVDTTHPIDHLGLRDAIL